MKKAVFPILILCFLFNIEAFAQNKIKADPLIPELLTLNAKMTKNNELGDRYKIQLVSTTYKEANEIKSEFQRKYDKWPVIVKYEPPNYKVWVGNFNSKLEAERAFVKLKKDYKSALIFRPKG